MTSTEKAVVDCLRLSDAAATALLPTIQRNISTAKADMLRAGVTHSVLMGDNRLAEDAVVTFCLCRMGDDSMRERNEGIYALQVDNLRKSVL